MRSESRKIQKKCMPAPNDARENFSAPGLRSEIPMAHNEFNLTERSYQMIGIDVIDSAHGGADKIKGDVLVWV